MVAVKKVVLVTAPHHPYDKFWRKIAESLSKELNAELEVKIEDYVYLVEYGDKDDLGMSWLPQILVELDDGRVQWVLSQIPLNDKLEPDEELAIGMMKEKLKLIGIGV